MKSRGLKVAPDGTVPYDQVLDFDKMTGLYQVPESKLFDRILITRKQVNVTVEIMNDPVYDVKLYQMDDFIDNGRKYLYELCDWLDLECFDNFVEYIMENKLEKSRSRKHDFFWPEKVKLAINKLIRNYPTYYSDGEKYIMWTAINGRVPQFHLSISCNFPGWLNMKLLQYTIIAQLNTVGKNWWTWSELPI